jgi:hypothetical protein
MFQLKLFQTFAEALLDLATYTSYIEPLREEVERVINKQGWTKAALGDMTKIDSFLRESQRVNGFGSCMSFFEVYILLETRIRNGLLAVTDLAHLCQTWISDTDQYRPADQYRHTYISTDHLQTTFRHFTPMDCKSITSVRLTL